VWIVSGLGIDPLPFCCTAFGCDDDDDAPEFERRLAWDTGLTELGELRNNAVISTGD
jgi:hypothetical protein